MPAHIIRYITDIIASMLARFVLLLALGMLHTGALAAVTKAVLAETDIATAPEPEFPPEYWYQIDVIVFRLKTEEPDDEYWPDIAASYPWNVTAITRGGTEQARPLRLSQLVQMQADLRAINTSGGRSGFDARAPSSVDFGRLLAAAETPESHAFEPVRSSLSKLIRRLNRAADVEVLGEQSWQQPITKTPGPVMIQAGERFDDRYEIEGTLSFSRSRYLHVRVELWLTRFQARFRRTRPVAPSLLAGLDAKTLAANHDLVAVERRRGQYTATSVHRLKESRKLRLDELHYLDHPLFGVIVKISRHTPSPTTRQLSP